MVPSNLQRPVSSFWRLPLRVVVGNEGQVNDAAHQTAGVNGIMRLPNRILHLIVGPSADQYAAEMAGQLA